MLSKQVWETLSAINVNSHIEKKGNLSYLSWAWAWDQLMAHYPDAMYEFDAPHFFADGSCEVWVTISITDGTESVFRRMWLPVMDNRNNAILNPDARKISDTRMRCLVKCLAMFGLGHYIYAGEDLPANAPMYSEEQKKAFDDLLNSSAIGLYCFRKRVGDDVFTALYNSFEPGQKVTSKEMVREIEENGRLTLAAMINKIEENDDLGALELVEGETKMVLALIRSQINARQRREFDRILEAAEK